MVLQQPRKRLPEREKSNVNNNNTIYPIIESVPYIIVPNLVSFLILSIVEFPFGLLYRFVLFLNLPLPTDCSTFSVPKLQLDKTPIGDCFFPSKHPCPSIVLRNLRDLQQLNRYHSSPDIIPMMNSSP